MKKQDYDDNKTEAYPDSYDLADGMDEDIDLTDVEERSNIVSNKDVRRRLEDYLEEKRMRELLSDEFDDSDFGYDDFDIQ